MNLLTLQEVGDYIKISPKNILPLLKGLNVDIYFLGAGRGRGYRVDKDSLISALESKKVIPEVQKDKIKKSNKFNMSCKDAMKLLTKPKSKL